MEPQELCPFCAAPAESGKTFSHCPSCGSRWNHLKKNEEGDPLPEQIGHYKILRSLGKGGMGEVFLAFDPFCQRQVALKRVRTDLISHEVIRSRFLREAHFTAQLTHPAIVAIYSIQEEEQGLYYTMPYVEGKTLRELFQETLKKEREQNWLQLSNEGSIPNLLRPFLSVCQAIAYAHSRGFLHRDLKPENVIVGSYGQVFILDWGLIQRIEEKEEAAVTTQEEESSSLTRPGKIVGTLAYMAPERAFGHPSTPLTDIYSLGIILYQLLSLRLPFRRPSLKVFKQHPKQELVDPSVVAPYRDIPPQLSLIVKKCLAYLPRMRYQSVDLLIKDLEDYLEGRSDWFRAGELKIEEKNDWKFQENFLIPEHLAITRGTEVTDWVTVMVSKRAYSGNIQLNAKVTIEEKGNGIGFLIDTPESGERIHPAEGYCIWLGSDFGRSTKLFRSTIVLMDLPDLTLKPRHTYQIRIEKVEHSIQLYLDEKLIFSYISTLPLMGSHIGLLYQDTYFKLSPISIELRSHNLMVSCLNLPNAFLASKNYTQALKEYRRIGYSFPWRAEGREALFRAGITLLEQGRASTNLAEAAIIFSQALKEFEKLTHTAGAPLEYWGKALVYEAMHEHEEEVKCLELAFRRYPKNPLIPLIKEHVLYRMHASSQKDRLTAYRLILLVIRHLPKELDSIECQKMVDRLCQNWESLPFLEKAVFTSKKQWLHSLAIQLAFWLSKPYTLQEILRELLDNFEEGSAELIENALFCLIEMGAKNSAQEEVENLIQFTHFPEIGRLVSLFSWLLSSKEEPLSQITSALFTSAPLPPSKERILFYFLKNVLKKRDPNELLQLGSSLSVGFSTEASKLFFDGYRIWALLLLNQWDEAKEQLNNYSKAFLNQESSLLHFLYGCWLQATQGKEAAMKHLSTVLETAYPRSWTLASHYLIGKDQEIQTWLNQAFSWEKKQLYLQLSLYYYCAGDSLNFHHFGHLESLESIFP